MGFAGEKLGPDGIETDVQVEWRPEIAPAITPELTVYYVKRASEMKSSIDQLGAETTQRQDRMRLVNDLISEINNLTDESNHLDISQNFKIQEKIRVLKELGVNISDTELRYSPTRRDRLIENLHLAVDNWDRENKNSTQKMEIYIKDLDRLMIILKEVNKSEKGPIRAMIAGIK